MLALVASGDEFLQSQELEVFPKILKKSADIRVVTVAVHRLAYKVSPIMAQLPLDIDKLGIELVLFVALGRIQDAVFVCHVCYLSVHVHRLLKLRITNMLLAVSNNISIENVKQVMTAISMRGAILG